METEKEYISVERHKHARVIMCEALGACMLCSLQLSFDLNNFFFQIMKFLTWMLVIGSCKASCKAKFAFVTTVI